MNNRMIYLDLSASLRTEQSFRSRRDEDQHTGKFIIEEL